MRNGGPTRRMRRADTPQKTRPSSSVKAHASPDPDEDGCRSSARHLFALVLSPRRVDNRTIDPTEEGDQNMSTLNPYISFKGQAKDAMDFYQSVFGGELNRSTFGEYHASELPEEQDLIMHSQLETPSGYIFMASDTPSHMDYTPGTNFSVSISGAADEEAELRGYWEGLLEGGTVGVPLEKAPWGDQFGMLTDKFGVTWLVNIAAPAA
jgi:PhnB protein